MGGIGSGRWPEKARDNLIEDGLRLSVRDLHQAGLLPPRPGAGATIRWSAKGEAAIGQGASVAVTVEAADENQLQVWLKYVVMIDRTSYRIAEPVRLTSTRLHSGGNRWWFCCPATQGDVSCGRLVGTLCLPSRARFFGCRRCHGLEYRCRREHKPQRIENAVL